MTTDRNPSLPARENKTGAVRNIARPQEESAS
jgi:hypothetical protein